MYKFVIKSITGEILYTSILLKPTVSEAQAFGNRILQSKRDWSPDSPISAKGNYVDVV